MVNINNNDSDDNGNKLLLSAMWNALNCSPDEEIDAHKVLDQYVQFRDNQEIDELKEEFIQEFGEEGSIVATRPARAIAFNGGSNPENPENYFPGMHYSLPLVSYTMRLALGNDPEEAYEKYIQGVDRIAENSGVEVEKHPTKLCLEKLCEPYLKKLCAIYLHNEGIIQEEENENIAEINHG